MTLLWSTLHLGLVAFVVTAVVGLTIATPIAFPEKSRHDALESVASPSSAALSTESVSRRSNRRRRSGYDVTEERDVDAFPFSAVMTERERQRNRMNLERNEHELFDGDDGDIAEKRGRWAKNNVQIWGKRSHPSDIAADQGGVYPQQHVSNRQQIIGLPRLSVPANDDGQWSKRKKTWEKNNFKMWGKRADSSVWNDQDTTFFDNDETSNEELQDHLIEAEASNPRQPSWAVRLSTGKGKGTLQHDIDEEFKRELIRTLISGANVDSLHNVELERPLMADDNDDDLEKNVALPTPVVSSDRYRLPWYKRGAWATNNMRIWG